ncbi:MAG: thiamine pyrophosphate-dependent enzyme, partial [Myxococcota bacterium]
RHPFAPGATVIDLVPVFDTQFVHRATAQLPGDVASNLEHIADGLAPFSVDVSELRGALHAAFRPAEIEFSPETLTAALSALPENTRITIDTGAHRILASQMLRRSAPGLTHQSTGLCTMGCALPTAIGAALADPDRPTVALVGDGGLEMVLGELGTARDLAVNLTVVVYDDRSLALIEKKQRARGLRNVGVDFGSADFAGTRYDLVAQAFDAHGVIVETLGDFTHALSNALAQSGTHLIACRLPRRGYDDVI